MGVFGSPIGLALYAMDLYEDALRDVDEQTRRDSIPAARDRLKESRLRWLEENRAERSFPCGVVPDPTSSPGDVGPPEPRLNVPRTKVVWMQVFAVVLPSDLAFIRGQDDGEVTEVGRLPRNAIREVDVVDQAGVHVPEPVSETFEPSSLALVVLRWTNEGAPDEDRFAFRSAWMAWQAARWLLEAKL
jgi:hypothetical protein